MHDNVFLRGEACVKFSSGAEVRDCDAGRYRIRVLEHDEASANLVLHYLRFGRKRLLQDKTMQNHAHSADIGAGRHPTLEGLQTLGLLHCRLSAHQAHHHEALRGVRICLFFQSAILIKPYPQFASAQTNAILAAHGAPSVLQKLPPLLAAITIRPNEVFGVGHFRQEGESLHVDSNIVASLLINIIPGRHAVNPSLRVRFDRLQILLHQ
mmetsp:Transcript_86786/g.185918  ORF Transcript_86786/g.185918 Transcript_86786/m.185918 type:complete len:210 (-) Transcript_86786:734-1363(-)